MPTRYGKLSDVLPKMAEDMHNRFAIEVGAAMTHLQKAMAILLGKNASEITAKEVQEEVWKRANAHDDAMQHRKRLDELIQKMRANPILEREVSEAGNIRDRFAIIVQTVIGEIMTDAKQKAEKDKPDEKIF